MAKKDIPENWTRRDFLKGTAAGTGAAALRGMGLGEAEGAAEIPKKWDTEADVIVAGFGGAGACSAIEAHDGGAKVLILENSPKRPGVATEEITNPSIFNLEFLITDLA